MKKLLMVLIVPLILLSCAEDIIVESASSLRGSYYGQYIVVEDAQSATATTLTEMIYWTFTDQRFDCERDTADVLHDIITCDFYGYYELESNVTFTQSFSKRNIVCDTTYFPEGVFSVQWTRPDDAADTLLLSQQIIDGNYMEWRYIKLWPEEEEEPEE